MDDWIACVSLFHLSAWIYNQPHVINRGKNIWRLMYNLKMFGVEYVEEWSCSICQILHPKTGIQLMFPNKGLSCLHRTFKADLMTRDILVLHL